MTWLQRRAKAIKERWERILLEELFLFSGGLEGAWTTSSGWVPGKELQHNTDRTGTTYRQGRVSSTFSFRHGRLHTAVGAHFSGNTFKEMLNVESKGDRCSSM